VDVRYESAKAGAVVTQGSIHAGVRGERSSASIVVDYSETASLMGAARDRWRNEDYRRYGHVDQRSAASVPPNIYSIDGSPLPGYASSMAATSETASGQLTLRPGEENLTSLQ